MVEPIYKNKFQYVVDIIVVAIIYVLYIALYCKQVRSGQVHRASLTVPTVANVE